LGREVLEGFGEVEIPEVKAPVVLNSRAATVFASPDSWKALHNKGTTSLRAAASDGSDVNRCTRAGGSTTLFDWTISTS
jgi:hypothetical protein